MCKEWLECAVSEKVVGQGPRMVEKLNCWNHLIHAGIENWSKKYDDDDNDDDDVSQPLAIIISDISNADANKII